MSEAWERKKLGELCEVITKGASPKWQGFKYLESPGVLFVRSENVGENEMLFQNKTKYVDSGFNDKHERSILRRGDVLTNLVGSIGRTAIYDRDDLANINQAVGILRCIPELINNRFLSYLLNSSAFRATFFSSAVDSRSNLSLTFFKNLEVPLPPLPEQKRIVAILDEAFGAIDRAKEIATQNVANAGELFESYLNRVFSEKGEGWEEKELGDLGRTQTGSTPKKANKDHYGDYIPFVKPADFQSNGSLTLSNNGLSQLGLENAREVPAGSALMVCIGATIGKSGFCESAITTNQQINAFIPNEEVDYRFAYYAFITRVFQQEVRHNSGQATLPIISKSKWSRLRISFPDRDEQRRIVATLGGIKQQQLLFESVIDRRLAALDELKQSILQKAFTGQLTANSPELEAVP